MSLEDCRLMVMRGAGEYDIINSICQIDISNQGQLYMCWLWTCWLQPKICFKHVCFWQTWHWTGQVWLCSLQWAHHRFFCKVARCIQQGPPTRSNIPITNRNAPLVLHLLCRKWSLLRWKLWMKRSILVFAMVSYLPPPTIHRLILGGVWNSWAASTSTIWQPGPNGGQWY